MLKQAEVYESRFWRCFMFVAILFYAIFLYLIIFYAHYYNERPESGSFEGIHFETEGVDRVCRLGQNTFSQSQAKITAKNGRMCTVEEVQKLVDSFSGLTHENSYSAAIDNGKPVWVEVSSRNGLWGTMDVPEEVKVLNAATTPWTEDVDYYNPKGFAERGKSPDIVYWYSNWFDTTNRHSYGLLAYWVGNVIVWCDK